MVLSLAVLIGFSYMFPQPKAQSDKNTTASTIKQKESLDSAAPSVTTEAPAVSQSNTPALAAQKTSSSSTGNDEIIATISAKDFIIKIDRLGRIKSTKLLKEKYQNIKGGPQELINPERTLPLEIRFSDTAINNEAFKTPYTASSSKVDLSDSSQVLTLTQKLSGFVVTKKITFYPDGHYDLEISTGSPTEFFVTPGHRPEVDTSVYMLVRGSLVRDSQGVLTVVEDGDAEKNEIIPDATIISSFDRYDASLFYSFDTPVYAIITVDIENDPLPFVKATQSLKLHGYIGPKDWRVFESIHPDLVNAIEFGWFTFLAKPFFAVMLWINNYVVNWGWTIILFTLLVKLVLFPLSYKGMMSMNKMRDLAPKMKELKEKYGKDPQKMNQQMMELYRKHGANPMGGCLPMLLQIPVFFALYRVLLNADELQGAPWIGWITDLSDKDPYFILPILMGISMYFQQKITPNTMTDPLQKKIFQWFPAIMTLFFLTFPSGLVLYWLTNNILSIAQQYYINHAYEKYKSKMKTLSKSAKKKD